MRLSTPGLVKRACPYTMFSKKGVIVHLFSKQVVPFLNFNIFLCFGILAVGEKSSFTVRGTVSMLVA